MEFVNCNLAKKLQEKGFPQVKKGTLAMYDYDGCIYHLCPTLNHFYYDFDDFDEHDCVCPTTSQVLDWFRKEHHLHCEVVGAAYGYNLIISDTPDKGGTDRYYSHANYDGPNYAGAWDKHEACVMYGIEYILDNLI
jgi:hypothetical protein